MKYVLLLYITTHRLISTFQIETILNGKLGCKIFRGVFPLDKLPDYLRPGAYVINTHSSNLPGEHWIAISVRNDIIRVFDPLDMCYPIKLVTTLERMQQPVEYNSIMYQNPLTTLCGNYCIDWLIDQYH